MQSKFRSLELLSVRGEMDARDPVRLRRLYRNRIFTGIVGAVSIAAFSVLCWVFFAMVLSPEMEPTPSRGERLAMVALTAVPGTLLAALAIYLVRRIARDPIRSFYLAPQDFELVRGSLVGGASPLVDGSHSKHLWEGRVEFPAESESERRSFIARFDPELIRTRLKGKKRLKGLGSLLPAPVWVAVEQRPGAEPALVGIDFQAVERIPPALRKSRSDLLPGFLILFTLAAAPVFWLPIFPDGRWVEAQELLERMGELREHCRALEGSIGQKPLREALEEPEWFAQLQFTAETIQFSRLKPGEPERVRAIFLEDCRERILAREGVSRLARGASDEDFLTLVQWISSVSTTFRSLARLELARDLLSEILKRRGTPQERERFAAWARRFDEGKPREIREPEALVRWIRKQGSELRDWMPDLVRRLLASSPRGA